MKAQNSEGADPEGNNDPLQKGGDKRPLTLVSPIPQLTAVHRPSETGGHAYDAHCREIFDKQLYVTLEWRDKVITALIEKFQQPEKIRDSIKRILNASDIAAEYKRRELRRPDLLDEEWNALLERITEREQEEERKLNIEERVQLGEEIIEARPSTTEQRRKSRESREYQINLAKWQAFEREVIFEAEGISQYVPPPPKAEWVKDLETLTGETLPGENHAIDIKLSDVDTRTAMDGITTTLYKEFGSSFKVRLALQAIDDILQKPVKPGKIRKALEDAFEKIEPIPSDYNTWLAQNSPESAGGDQEKQQSEPVKRWRNSRVRNALLAAGIGIGGLAISTYLINRPKAPEPDVTRVKAISISPEVFDQFRVLAIGDEKISLLGAPLDDAFLAATGSTYIRKNGTRMQVTDETGAKFDMGAETLIDMIQRGMEDSRLPIPAVGDNDEETRYLYAATIKRMEEMRLTLRHAREQNPVVILGKAGINATPDSRKALRQWINELDTKLGQVESEYRREFSRDFAKFGSPEKVFNEGFAKRQREEASKEAEEKSKHPPALTWQKKTQEEKKQKVAGGSGINK